MIEILGKNIGRGAKHLMLSPFEFLRLLVCGYLHCGLFVERNTGYIMLHYEHRLGNKVLYFGMKLKFFHSNLASSSVDSVDTLLH